MTTLPIPFAGRPKRNLIDMAFEECGVGGYEFDRDPEEINMALRRLNALMGEWPWKTIDYNMPDYGDGQPEDVSGVPFDAENAVALHLAQRVAAGMRIPLGAEHRAARAQAKAQFLATLPAPRAVEIPNHEPRGGNWRGRFYR